MMKRLLFATDLSSRAHWAMERSLLLARGFNVPLTVLHVVDEDLPEAIARHHHAEADQTIRHRLAALPAHEGIELDVRVVLGRAAREILRHAEEEGAGVIVLGTPREERFADMFRGTTPERVLRGARVPVLVVAAAKIPGPYRRVMIGVDFSMPSRRAIERAVALFPEASFFLIHAYEVPFAGFLHGRDSEAAVGEQHERKLTAMINDEMQALEQGHDGRAPLFQRVMGRGRAPEVIRCEVERLRPDLLVVGTHGRTGVPHAIIGSVAEDLLSDPPCDVMAVKGW